MVSCRVLTDEKEIEALASGWRRLQARVGLSPFTDYDLAQLWWQEIGRPSGAALRVAACFDGDELVGVIPFVVHRRYGTRVLFLLGHEIYYYRNFLVADPRYVPPLWRTILDDPSYDMASLKDIHDGTAEYAFLSSLTPPFRRSFACHCELHGESREALIARYPRSLRRNVRKVGASSASGGEIELGSCLLAEPPSEIVDFLVEAKTDWALRKEKKSIFRETNGAVYFKKLVRLVACQKRAAFFWMILKGKIVATTFSIVEKNMVYAHAAAFDPVAASLSPGNVVTVEEIVWASQKGYAETNFMEGEEPYKAILGDGRRAISDFLFGRTLRGRAYRALFAGLTLYREARGRWRQKRARGT